MIFPRHTLLRPGLRVRLAAGLFTMAALLPILLRLPRVSVVACFDSGHGLYQWVPNISGGSCVSAPTAVVGWTLMIASTLLVQLLLLPLLLTAGVLLVRVARHGVARIDQALLAVLRRLAQLFVPQPRPIPIPIRTHYRNGPTLRENPHRGPPSCG